MEAPFRMQAFVSRLFLSYSAHKQTRNATHFSFALLVISK